MKLDAYSLFDELNIAYDTHSKHSTAGRLQLQCPYCDDGSSHLGYHIQKEYFNCWICGWHPLVETVATIAGVDNWEAQQAIERNRTGRTQIQEKLTRPNDIVLPPGSAPMIKRHIKYLLKRGFALDSIKQLEKTHGIVGTGLVGDYNFRIMFPITYYNKLVSYQGRDITGHSKFKYMACSTKKEVRAHQKCLYAADQVKGKSVVVVEGIIDALKLGPGAVATFGTSMLWPQIRQLADRWEKRYIAFDMDNAGTISAKKLHSALSLMPGKTYIVKFDKHDPGEFTQDEAKEFMNTLNIKG